MRFLCAQPASTYYAWQVEVMLNSFLDVDINLNSVDIVCCIDKKDEIPDYWRKLSDAYPARFFFYEDKRKIKNYISSIRPNILKQHFKKHPYLEKETIFYHDNDMVFTKKIDFSQFEGDDTWYGSDCRWYIGHDYILSKGEDVLSLMCSTCGIDKALVRENELNSIGAQYIMKGVDWRFWSEVEVNSEKMFVDVTELNVKKKEQIPSYHEVQIWCADMWALLWAAWKRGKKTVCHPDLQFSWATSFIQEWYDLSIFHNAGVTESSQNHLFFKANFIDSIPYNADLSIDKNFASFKYWELIKKTARRSVLT